MSRFDKLRAKLREVNRKRRNRTAHGHDHVELDAQRKRLLKKIKWLKDHQDPEQAADGTADWRGYRVAGWMVGASTGPDGKKVNWLELSVKHGWDGGLSSGYRSPEYSESLCRNMCGAPSCPGRCAGRASNHSQVGPPNWGAVDVYPEYVKFESIQKQIGSPLKNELDERDPVHFSFTGR